MTTAEKLVEIAENEQKVYEAGKEAEYNAFWDAYIGKDGDVIAAVSMFSGYRWIDDIYNPKHTIKASNFSSMYQNCPITDTKVTLDVSNGSGTNLFFNATNLKNIVKLIVSSKNTFGSWFYGCTALEEIRFEGVIGNSLDIHWSTKLSAESYYSIITALSSSVSGQKFIVPPTAEATYNANPPQGDGIPQTWAELIGTKSNWTIAES